MDTAELITLARAGETYSVEFKGEQQERLNDQNLVRAVVCLANGSGGYLLVGVEDDGEITGARPRHEAGTDPGRLQALIANNTQPPLSTEVSVVPAPAPSDPDRNVVAILVPDADQPIGTKKAEYVRRATDSHGRPQCVPYLAHEMLSRAIDNRQQDYARLPVAGAVWDDLDPREFERFRGLARASGPGGDPVIAELSDQDIALALGVATRDAGGNMVPYAGALILFGRVPSIKRWVPTSEVLFQVFDGSSLVSDETWSFPLFSAAEQALARLAPYNRETEIEADFQRIAVQRLPTTVIRETVANALIHRDYTINGPTVIQLRDATFEVISMGGFPPGITLGNLMHMTRPRSPILSEAFKRAGFVERSGRGVQRVYEALLQSGRRGPDYSQTNRDLVHVTVPLAEGDLPLAKYFAQQVKAGQSLGVFELQVLFELKHTGPLFQGEVQDLTASNEYQVAAMLNRLTERGYIERDERSGEPRYYLASAVYRSLGDASAYVRIHGGVTDDVEAQILEYVHAHGEIRRREAAELAHISADVAGRVLARMTRARSLILHGEKRAAYYTAP